MWNNKNNNFRNNRGWGRQDPMAYAYPAMTTADRSSLITKVMWFTTFSIVAAIAGVYVGAGGLHSAYNISRGSSLLWFIAEIALLIGALLLRNKSGINFIMLYGFTFVTGVTIAPLMQILADNGYGGIIIQALGITGALTIGLGLYAWTTKRDFSGFAPYLFVATIGLLLVMLLNIFFASTLLSSIIMYAGVLIFSFWLIFDVQQAKRYENTVGNAIAVTIGIYLDILNIFLFILQILLSFQDN
jgi:FtsH-binding integral membrane protein